MFFFVFLILLQQVHPSPPPSIGDLVGQSSYVLVPIAKSGTIIIIHEKKGKSFLVSAGTYVNVPAEFAYKVISNFEKWDEFVPTVKSVKFVKHLDEERSIWEYNLSLKISILQVKLKYYMEHHYERAPARIWMHTAEGYESDVNSIASWEIIPVGREACLIFYSVWADFRRVSFFVDWILRISSEFEVTIQTATASTLVGIMKKKIHDVWARTRF